MIEIAKLHISFLIIRNELSTPPINLYIISKMASGLKLEESLLNQYESDFKKTGSKLVGMTLKISKDGGKEGIVVDKTFDREGFNHDAYVEAFPTTEGRIGLLKYSGKTDDGRPLKKVILILWTPMSSTPMQRMQYSSCFGSVKDELTGVDFHIQCSDIADISAEKVEAEVKSRFK